MPIREKVLANLQIERLSKTHTRSYMYRSEEAEKAWFYYESFALVHMHKMLQKKIIDAYFPYRHLVERYSKVVKHVVCSLSDEYLEERPEITEQNVALLKNAMELWKVASRTSDAVAPMLYHYSWHCFNSFLMYSFFSWEPQHAHSHGIRISKWSDSIADIEIKFTGKPGLFQRLVDTWTLLGASLAFSSFIPVFEGAEIEFTPNSRYLLDSSNCLSVSQLLSFDATDFERQLYSDGREKLIRCPFLINSISLPNDCLKNYLIVFVASSLARYRPILWNSVLIGKNEQQSYFALCSRKALAEYTSGRDGTGFLYQISRLLRDIWNGKFEFKKST